MPLFLDPSRKFERTLSIDGGQPVFSSSNDINSGNATSPIPNVVHIIEKSVIEPSSLIEIDNGFRSPPEKIILNNHDIRKVAKVK